MCDCETLADPVEATPRREDFLVGKTVIASDAQIWAELAVCDDCGQRWRVDFGAEADRRANLAYRIPAHADWQRFDIYPALREHRIRKAGGLSSSPCAWAGCPNRALRDTVICVDHTFKRSSTET